MAQLGSSEASLGDTALRPRRSTASRLLNLARRNPAGVVSLLIILVASVVAIFAPLLAPYDYNQFSTGPRLDAPSLDHLFGTDGLGRDLLSRIIYGARIALLVSFSAISVGVSIGTVIGLVSGWFEGAVDQILQRFIDALMAFPSLLMAMALVAVLGPGLDKLLIALSVLMLPTASRTVRGTVLSAKQNLYVEAARALGASSTRVLLRHILPNVTAPIMVVITVMIGAVIIAEAALSFVGLGVQPPTPSWGQMLSGEGKTYMERAPWLVIFPTLSISITVLAFNFLGDALRDIWDPRLRGAV